MGLIFISLKQQHGSHTQLIYVRAGNNGNNHAGYATRENFTYQTTYMPLWGRTNTEHQSDLEIDW